MRALKGAFLLHTAVLCVRGRRLILVIYLAGWSQFSPLGEIELSFSLYHLCTWSKLHQMFLKCGSFGALSQCLITEHFLVSFGGLLGAFQSPASRVCGHFSVSQIPLQCGQSCPMVKCLKFYVKWKMVFWLQWFNICQSPCLQGTPSLFYFL